MSEEEGTTGVGREEDHLEEVGPDWACEGRRSLGQVREVHADPEPQRGGAKV